MAQSQGAESTEENMSDHLQARAVRVQSSAIVVAAVITTCGAVTSALIQSGWSTKLSTPSTFVAEKPLPEAPPAFVAEALDVPRELMLASASMSAASPQNQISEPTIAKSKTAAKAASAVTFHAADCRRVVA